MTDDETILDDYTESIDIDTDPAEFDMADLVATMDETSQRLGGVRVTRHLYPEADEEYPRLAECEPVLADRVEELGRELARRLGDMAERVDETVARFEAAQGDD